MEIHGELLAFFDSWGTLIDDRQTYSRTCRAFYKNRRKGIKHKMNFKDKGPRRYQFQRTSTSGRGKVHSIDSLSVIVSQFDILSEKIS